MGDRSIAFNQKTSTPFERLKNVRQSLGRIKKNTVSGMVNLFTQRKKLMKTDSGDSLSEVDRKPSLFGDDRSIISDQISYFNELSLASESSVNSMNSKWNATESDDNFMAVRQRSQSCNASSIKHPSSVIAAYAKYPNFKWSQLKYFGVDPKTYLASFNIDYDDVGNISTGSTSFSGNGGDLAGVDFDIKRKRSQSFGAKSLSRPTNVTVPYRSYPNFKLSQLKYFGADSSHRDNANIMKNRHITRPESFSTIFSGSLLRSKLNGHSESIDAHVGT